MSAPSAIDARRGAAGNHEGTASAGGQPTTKLCPRSRRSRDKQRPHLRGWGLSDLSDRTQHSLAEVWVPQQSNSRRGDWFHKEKPPPKRGPRTKQGSCVGPDMQQAPPTHLRGPTRPNWGGGRSPLKITFSDATLTARCNFTVADKLSS